MTLTAPFTTGESPSTATAHRTAHRRSRRRRTGRAHSGDQSRDGGGLHRGIGRERRGRRRRRPERARHVSQRDVAPPCRSTIARSPDQPVRRRHRRPGGRLYRTRDEEQRPADHRDQGADHAACPSVPVQRRAAARRPGPRWCHYEATTTPTRLGSRSASSASCRRSTIPMMIASKSLAPALGHGKHRGAQAF